MANLNQSHGLTPLEKSQFSQCLNFLIFFSLERRCFVLEYRKTHFLAYIALKEKDGKKANFGPKPWTNPF